MDEVKMPDDAAMTMTADVEQKAREILAAQYSDTPGWSEARVKDAILRGDVPSGLRTTIRALVAALHATTAKDAEIEALRAEVGLLRHGNVAYSQQVADLIGRAGCAEARVDRLAEAGRRVTTAFRAHGEASIAESARTRRECEDAMLALDAALAPEAK